MSISFFEDRFIQLHKDIVDTEMEKFWSRGSFVGNDGQRELDRLKLLLIKSYKNKNIATCANGTDALLGSLVAAGVKRGDLVIVSALSWLSSVTVISQLGASPIFCDVDPNTGLADINNLNSDTIRKAKAAVLVHLYGNVCDVAEWRKKYPNLKIIEDCAQAYGSLDKYGNPVGQMGDFATFSLFPTKNLGCYGDGGFVICAPSDKAKLESFFKLGQGSEKANIPCHSAIGINSRLDPLQALLVCLKLETGYQQKIMHSKRMIFNEYFKRLKKIIITQHSNHVNPHLCVVKVRDRQKIIEKLSEAKIPSIVHYPRSLNSIDYFADTYQKCSNAEHLASSILSLPFHPFLTLAEINHICDIVSYG